MFNDSHKRYLQSILDSVSAGLNLPIRLLSLDELRSLKPNHIKLTHELEELDSAYSKIISVISSPATADLSNADPIKSIETLSLTEISQISEERYRCAASKIAKTEYCLFKTMVSNSHTVVDLFRLSPEWRWYELLWIYCNRALFDKTNNELFTIPAFGLPSWHFVCIRLSSDTKYLIITGPLNFIERNVDRGQYFINEGKILRDIYVKFYENFCRRSVTKRFSTEELDRVLRLRVPVTSATIRSRVKLAEKVISFVSNHCSTLLSNRERIAAVEPTSLRAVADLALAAGRLSKSYYFYDCLEFYGKQKGRDQSNQEMRPVDNSEKTRMVVFSFTIPLGNLQRLSLDIKVCVNRRTPPDSIRWNFQTMEDTGVASDSSRIISLSVDGVRIDDPTFMLSIAQKIDRWNETAYARRKSYLANRSNLIGGWLSHNFLKTKNDTENGNAGVTGKRSAAKLEVYNVICDFIAESTRTEMCQIYRFYSHIAGGTMKVLGGSVRGDIWSTRDSDMVIDHMTNFASDATIPIQEKIEKSIVYRAAAQRKMCYEEISELSDSSRISWPTEVSHPRGIVAAPILIEGRVWGVIEIATPCAGAIDTSTQYSLSDYSGVLGVYFFSITYNQNIRSLSLWAGSEFTQMPNQIAEVSNRFAERICRITLGQSALVLIQKSNEGGCVYDIAGYTGENEFQPDVQHAEIDVKSRNGERFLAGKLWRAYVESETTFISAKVDRHASEADHSGDGDYIVLGKNYFESLDDEGDVGDFISESTSQIMAFTFDVVSDLEKPIKEKVFGIDLDTIRRVDEGPTGMVLVYFDDFIDRPHWHGVNADIAIRLANCYKDILIDRQRQSDKGALVRHEVKQTVFAIAAAASEIRRTSDYIRRNITASLSVIETQQDAPESLNDISDSAIRLGKLTNNMHSAYDLLLTQIQSIERADYADLSALSATIPEGIVRSTYTCIPEILDRFALQYKKRFYNRRLTYRFGEMPENLHIRIKTEYVSFLVRNIFDNWAKYAPQGTVVSVELSPSYNIVKRPESYKLVFSNYVETQVSQYETESWFEYGKRDDRNISKAIDGDGIGLFWIRQILQRRFGIRVFFELSNTDSNRSKIALCWIMSPQWLTTHPELEISE